MTSSKLVAAVILALAVLSPVEASAQAEVPSAEAFATARTLYKEGKELRAKGDMNGALEKFRAAHELGRTPVTGIELARTYAALGRLVEAREICLSIGRMAVAPDETSKSADARSGAAKLADDLAPRIASLSVTIEGASPGEPVHLVVDGTPVPDVALAEALRVNPGRREVIVRAGEGPTARETDASPELGEGETRAITVTLPPPMPMPMPAPTPTPTAAPRPTPTPSSAPTLVLVGFATALAGAAVGTIAGVVALQKKNALDCPDMVCDQKSGSADALNETRTWATVSDVAFVVGGVGAGVAIVGLFNGAGEKHAREAREPHVEPWVGVGAVGLHGAF